MAIWHFFPSQCFSLPQKFPTFFFSATIFLNSSLFHAYCAQRIGMHVFVLDSSTTSKKKWVKELSAGRSGDLTPRMTFLKATQRSQFN